MRRTPIGDEEKLLLAEALGDTPETAIAVHLLRRGLCTAHIGDEPAEAAIVQSQALQGDVYAFGVTLTRLGSCLMSRRGWRRVSALKSVSRLLGAAVEQQTGIRISYETVVYHTLKAPVVGYRDTAIHRLTQQNSHLLTAAPPQLHVGAFGDMNTLLGEGVVACAVVDGDVVTIAYT